MTGLRRPLCDTAMVAAAILASQAFLAQAQTAPAAQGDAAKLLGTYECNNGHSAAVAIGLPQPRTDSYTPARPMLRLTLKSTTINAKPDLLWWNEKDKAWKEDISTELVIKRVEVTDKYWAIVFEGAFGDRLPGIVAGMLSYFSSSVPTARAKPNLVISQYSAMFAGGTAVECDKL
jgi:hypothetical protein